MPEPKELVLRIVCYAAGALLLFQLGHFILYRNPVAKLRIPSVPTLTNQSPFAPTPVAATPGAIPGPTPPSTPATNLVSTNKTVAALNQNATTNKSSTGAARTNRASKKPGTLASLSTNAPNTGTNISGTNVARSANSTNSSSPPVASAPKPNPPLTGAMLMGRGGRGPAVDLPKDVVARVDRVTDSEILAPVMRPLPMALLGIAGEHVFLRAPNGQTGLVKTGDTLGGVKLLAIGINRVLVEEDGQSKELMIFSGLGGESLVPKAKTNL